MDNFTELTPEQIERDRMDEIAEEYGMYGVSDVWEFNELREKYNRSRGHLRDKTPGSVLDYFPMWVQYCILTNATRIPNKYSREPFSRKVDRLIDEIIFVCRMYHNTLDDEDIFDDDLIKAYISPFYIELARHLIEVRDIDEEDDGRSEKDCMWEEY